MPLVRVRWVRAPSVSGQLLLLLGSYLFIHRVHMVMIIKYTKLGSVAVVAAISINLQTDGSNSLCK